MSCSILEKSPFIPHSQSRKQHCFSLILSKLDYCSLLEVFLLACPKTRLNVCRQYTMQRIKLSWNVWKLTTSRQFSENCIGFLLKTASTINYSPSHTCHFMETLVSSSLNFFIFTPLLALSDQHLDVFLEVPRPRAYKTKRCGQRASRCVVPSPLECPAWRHQGNWFCSVFQCFSENSQL